MDRIIIGIVVLAAVWYLFRWFRSAAKRGNDSCGCGTCGGTCGGAEMNCGGNSSLIPDSGKGFPDKTENREVKVQQGSIKGGGRSAFLFESVREGGE